MIHVNISKIFTLCWYSKVKSEAMACERLDVTGIKVKITLVKLRNLCAVRVECKIFNT